jgi:hypothetical protein
MLLPDIDGDLTACIESASDMGKHATLTGCNFARYSCCPGQTAPTTIITPTHTLTPTPTPPQKKKRKFI